MRFVPSFVFPGQRHVLLPGSRRGRFFVRTSLVQEPYPDDKGTLHPAFAEAGFFFIPPISSACRGAVA